MEKLNLTQGTIWKTLLRFSMPMVLSSFLQSAYSLADLAIAGFFVGDVAISAINNSSQVLLFLTQIIMGITMGGNILMGQYFGKQDHENRVQTNRTLFMLALIAGTVVVIGLLLFGRSLLVLLRAPALEEAVVYITICAVGLLPVFGYNAIAAMMRAVGDSKRPLYFILITASLNVVLDILFMGPLNWGVAGAAWATVIAQVTSFAVALLYVNRHKALYGLVLTHLYIKMDKLKNMLRLGIPTAIQMTLVGISWMTMTFLVNAYGVEASAASGIAAKVRDMSQLFTIAMGSAASTMVAQCLGAEQYDRASRSVHVAMRITIGVALVQILLVELFAPALVGLFNPNELTTQLAVLNLRIEILAQVFYASFMVYNALAIGAGHTLFALASSIMNSIVARLILALVFNHYFGLVGIFWACMIAPVASVPLGYLYEKSGIWRKSLVKEADVQQLGV